MKLLGVETPWVGNVSDSKVNEGVETSMALAYNASASKVNEVDEISWVGNVLAVEVNEIVETPLVSNTAAPNIPEFLIKRI